MKTSEDVIILPNLGAAEFFGVDSKPDTLIVQLSLGDGHGVAFCTTAEQLRDIGVLFVAHAKQKMDEADADAAAPAPSFN